MLYSSPDRVAAEVDGGQQMGEGASPPEPNWASTLWRGGIRTHDSTPMLPIKRLGGYLTLVILLLAGSEVQCAKAPAPSSTPLKKEPQAPVRVLHNAWTLKGFRQFIDAR